MGLGTATASRRWLVVDASVWVSRYIPMDAHHLASDRWLRHQLTSDIRIVLPTLLLVEIAGAVARRTGDDHYATQAAHLVRRLPRLRWVAIGGALLDHATALAAELRLRGADAVYVALADRLRIPLVTWDGEQLNRTTSRITAYSPS